MSEAFSLNIPQDVESRFRYDGNQRYIILYFTPNGDEATISDGKLSYTTNFQAYRKLMSDLGEQFVRKNEDDLQGFLKGHITWQTDEEPEEDVTVDEFVNKLSNAERLLEFDSILRELGYNVGGSSETPDHCFVLDLDERRVHVSPIGTGRDIVEDQH